MFEQVPCSLEIICISLKTEQNRQILHTHTIQFDQFGSQVIRRMQQMSQIFHLLDSTEVRTFAKFNYESSEEANILQSIE